jgi:hypothetical protein
MLRLLFVLAAFALTASPLAAQTRPERPPEGPEKITLETIQTHAHGMVFDARQRRLQLDGKLIATLQQSLADAVAKARPAVDKDSALFARRITARLDKTPRADDRAYLTAALLNRQLARIDDKQTDYKALRRYAFLNRVLYEQARSYYARIARGKIYQLSPEILALLREGRLIVAYFQTAYIGSCRTQQVPVPPNFSLASTTWIKQGNLASNMLDPGAPAAVWTWTDPARRGACIALPRNNGGAGSFAGIICQSAKTGRACFWDNLTRADPGRRIPTATETMVIADLQDGTTLDVDAPCTDCHVGNNVYLMLPEDPAWRKIVKGPMNGPRPGTFTTIVEPQTDTPMGPRYTPLAHPSWVNPPLSNGCSGPCHSAPSAAITSAYYNLPGRPPMPPACAVGNNYKLCYGTP